MRPQWWSSISQERLLKRCIILFAVWLRHYESSKDLAIVRQKTTFTPLLPFRGETEFKLVLHSNMDTYITINTAL